MKQRILLLTVVIAAISLAVHAARLGSLKSDDTVFTPADDVAAPSVTTKDGFPVFEIRVPDGFLEVQVRASLANFEPGFLLKDGANFVLNYVSKVILGMVSPLLGLVTSYQEQIEWHLRIVSLLVGLLVCILSLVSMVRKLRRR